MGKSEIKHDIFRKHFATAVRAIRKGANEGKNNFVPSAEPADTTQTLANVTYIVEDTGVRFHGFDNVARIDVRDEDAGYRVTGATGDSLVQFILAPVRRAFNTHPHIRTFIMVMDKGCFMPRPKQYVQTLRTQSLVDSMEQKGIQPIEVPEGGALPDIVAAGKMLPPWAAVRANRTLYRHATCKVFDMIAETYKPPPGCRVILDYLDLAATAPETLDDWMCSKRLLCDDYARSVIEESRELLRDRADWRTEARHILSTLAHGGHVESLSICIETDLAGNTFSPFVLENSGNTCGEADVGILFWLQNMQADRQHLTLEGLRNNARVVPEENKKYYTVRQLLDMANQAELAPRVPEPLAVQRAWAANIITQAEQAASSVFADFSRGGNVDIVNSDLTNMHHLSNTVQHAKKLALKLHADNPCREPNRGMVFSCDTDFLSLLPLWYAQMCAETARAGKPPSYCFDNAPLLCIGECQVVRVGWLNDYTDYYEKPKAPSKKRTEAGAVECKDVGGMVVIAQEPIVALEIYDIARVLARLNQLLDEKGGVIENPTPEHYVARAASFAVFCASCENDFLAGLYYVNRTNMFAAFLDLCGDLVQYGELESRENVAVVIPAKYTQYVKHCYYHSLNNARGNANKPERPATALTYTDMAALVRKKYKTSEKSHMPSLERIKLIYQRLQWWLIYALRSHASITQLLDDTVWGWPPGTTDVMA